MMTVLVLVVLALILGFGGVIFYNQKKKQAAASWVQTQGTVISSTIATERDRDSDGHVTTYYNPEVNYAYTVGGVEHRGHRIKFGFTRTQFSAQAAKTTEKYPQGAAVTVYYDPAKPQDSVLDRGKEMPAKS